MIDLGHTRYRKDGDVIYADNDFITMAYVASDHPSDFNTDGVHGTTLITFVSRDVFRMLEAACTQERIVSGQ